MSAVHSGHAEDAAHILDERPHEEYPGHDDAHVGAVHDVVRVEAGRRTDAAARREQRGDKHRYGFPGQAENGHHRRAHVADDGEQAAELERLDKHEGQHHVGEHIQRGHFPALAHPVHKGVVDIALRHHAASFFVTKCRYRRMMFMPTTL